MYFERMARPSTYATLLAALVCTGTAWAQPPAQQGNAPSVQPGTVLSPVESAPLRVSPVTGLFEGTGPGLDITTRNYRVEDGSSAVRQGLVRSWEVSEGLSAGVGIFAVTHDNQKEPEFRRNWSAKNLGPRNRKVAAVGLNLRF